MKKAFDFRRLGLDGSIEHGAYRLVIRLPDPRFLRLLARSVLLAAAFFSFPWLRSALLPHGDVSVSQPAVNGENVFLPSLLRDLSRRGLLRPEDNVIFLNDPIKGVRTGSAVPDSSADFVFSASAGEFEHVDRILKVGGVAAVRLGRNPLEAFHRPGNYRTTYMGRIGSAAVVAMRKSSAGGGELKLRRLLTVPEAKKEALSGLEEAMLEPPEPGRRSSHRKARYLPELTGDALDEYPRRVFVEVATAGEAGSGAAWFQQNYPTKGRVFDVIQVEVKDEKNDDAAVLAEPEIGTPSLAEWLERNVKEDEYVVVKAEASAVEEAVAEGAIGLVDELFLECDHQQWEDDEAKKTAKGARRAYWECLVLYGKLRDAGVAVHQWWSF
ncbi:hypothetical protein Cni_G02132 [Canna indica]|uniref:DUF7870 domain-containing protein n=1 Tax=Canna indica TaxID=4628 RepID=A0AAQ3PZC2_9LILI|nr:hypothetical protein Cni_G02132 [Canna indica]